MFIKCIEANHPSDKAYGEAVIVKNTLSFKKRENIK